MYHLKGISNLLSFLGIDGNEIKHNHSNTENLTFWLIVLMHSSTNQNKLKKFGWNIVIDDLNAKQKSIKTLNFLVYGQISFTDIRSKSRQEQICQTETMNVKCNYAS